MLSENEIYIQSVVIWLLFAGVFFSGYLLRWFFAGKKIKSAEMRAKTLTDSAQKDAEHRRKEAELQGKDLMIKLRQDFERETKARREEGAASEKRLQQREENLDKRLDALQRLQQQGWPIGIRFDPLIYYPDWREGYRQMFDQVFNRLEASRIHSVSLGLFRLPVDFARTISRLYPEDPLLAGPLEVNNGLSSYLPALGEEMLGQCRELLLEYISPQQLFLCQEQNSG